MGQIGKLALCLGRMDGLHLDTLVDRKILQKRVYFLQEFGVELGYSFGFYIYGPYSSELTTDAFFLVSLKDQAPATLETVKLTQAEEEGFEKATKFLAGVEGKKEEIAYSYELLSSLHFLWSVSYFKNKSKTETFKRLKERKNIQDETDLEKAWNHLKTCGLIR